MLEQRIIYAFYGGSKQVDHNRMFELRRWIQAAPDVAAILFWNMPVSGLATWRHHRRDSL
jgi:hypothetical protein